MVSCRCLEITPNLTWILVQSFDNAAFGDDAVYGCDFVGKVMELGENTSLLGVGDIVAGLIWGGQYQHLMSWPISCIHC